jgi:hypothetical protein
VGGDAAQVMVGRDRELARVTGLLDDALAGRGRLVLCTGEAGIGKTRLAEELAAVAGNGFPVGVVARMLDRPVLSLLGPLDEGRGIPLGVHFLAAVSGQPRPDQRMVVGQHPRVPAIPQPSQQGRGALNIGEQEGERLHEPPPRRPARD